MVEFVSGRVWFDRIDCEKEKGRSWVNRLVRRGPKREEENARMNKMERKRRMETVAVRRRKRERGEGDARVAGIYGKSGLLCRGEVVFVSWVFWGELHRVRRGGWMRVVKRQVYRYVSLCCRRVEAVPARLNEMQGSCLGGAAINSPVEKSSSIKVSTTKVNALFYYLPSPQPQIQF
jgi:hypothetical protein